MFELIIPKKLTLYILLIFIYRWGECCYWITNVTTFLCAYNFFSSVNIKIVVSQSQCRLVKLSKLNHSGPQTVKFNLQEQGHPAHRVTLLLKVEPCVSPYHLPHTLLNDYFAHWSLSVASHSSTLRFMDELNYFDSSCISMVDDTPSYQSETLVKGVKVDKCSRFLRIGKVSQNCVISREPFYSVSSYLSPSCLLQTYII